MFYERYFFYIINLTRESPREIVLLANDRCDQENLIEQLKNGTHAMKISPRRTSTMSLSNGKLGGAENTEAIRRSTGALWLRNP